MLWVAVAGCSHGISPFGQLRQLLDWLAIPSRWLAPVEVWMAQREEFVAAVAAMTLLIAILFAAANGWRSRSGSTAILSVVIVFQAGRGFQLVLGIIVVLALVAVATILAIVLVHRFGWVAPQWTHAAREHVGRVVGCISVSALYFLSPLGWMVSQDVVDARGTLWNPLYVNWTEPSGPSGHRI